MISYTGMNATLLTAATLIALAAPAAGAECVRVHGAPDGALTVHAAPSHHAGVRRWAYEGDRLTVYEATAEWSRVRRGWVDSRYITDCQHWELEKKQAK